MIKAKDELIDRGDFFFKSLTINSSFQFVCVEPVLVQYCLYFAILNLAQLYNLMLSFLNYFFTQDIR